MIRVVSPYRPFAPESEEHRALGPFDWVGALAMLGESVRRSCEGETFAITDHDTTLPVPTFHYATQERRLMLWILEVSLCYLESSHFDRDTVMVSPDMLVLGDLCPWFGADLGILVRLDDKHQRSGRVILNQAQWWQVKGKKRLQQFYRRALALARRLPEPFLTWGADTEPLRRLLLPLEVGDCRRAGLKVRLIDAGEPMESLSSVNINRLAYGLDLRVAKPLLDFRYTRKHHLRAVFEALFPAEVPA